MAKILISGGGTGGHIFPALAIANEIKRRLPDTEFLFVGANGKMEMEKVPAAGYTIEGLSITGIDRKLSWKNVLFPFRLVTSIMKSRKIIHQFKPNIAIGTGGFASGPALIAAQQLGVKTVIQEQNYLPGITNKRLASRAKFVYVAYDNMHKFFPENKIIKTGNPVRRELFSDLPSQSQAKEFFGLNPAQKLILSVGGSLGSSTLNSVWLNDLHQLQENRCQLLWQTGKSEYKTIASKVMPEKVKVVEFIHRMDMAYAAADVIVSRAGAIAISELALVGKPIVLVPFPFAAEDHQTKNAIALESAGAALRVEDSNAKNILAKTVIGLLNDKAKSERLTENIKQFANINATQDIVDHILTLIHE